MTGFGLSACGGNSSNDSGYGGRSGEAKGRLTLSITDAAVDNIAEVWIEFTSIELKPAEGPSVMYLFEKNIDVTQTDGSVITEVVEAPVSINLLDLQGSLSKDFFNGLSVPSGNYNWVRLGVNAQIDGTQDSYVVMKDGNVHELDIPSGSQTGLKINTGFTVGSNADVAMTIDFDLRKSIVMSGSTYHLKPVLRMVENIHSGQINGSVGGDLLITGCSDLLPETGNAVYVFSGADAELDDIDNQAPEPITTALLTFNASTGEYDYEVGFLPEGDYTVAYTCMADLDDPETDDVISFSQVSNVSVSNPDAQGGAEFNR